MARLREAGKEERIQEAALKVFGRQSFQATTLKDIAREASISTGSIYTYFQDKEALFRATVDRYWDSFIDGLEGIGATASSREERITSILDRGFLILGSALPLTDGMLFEAGRLNLIEPKLDRACEAIDALLLPDEDGTPLAEWERARPRRLAVIRVMILGVLSSAALVSRRSPQDALEWLRDTVGALLVQMGVLRPEGSAEARTGGLGKSE
jgi:AcrR family transcriptional regulator